MHKVEQAKCKGG